MGNNSVLIIDSDLTAQQEMARVLSELGYAVRVANSGKAGLKVFEKQPFDVVISEATLVDMDGLVMLQQMCMRDAVLVAIVATSQNDQETAIRAIEMGAACFLKKPVSTEKLQTVVVKKLSERQKEVDTRHFIGDLIKDRSVLRGKITESEQYLSYLLDAAPFGIISTGGKKQVITCNAMAEKIYGYAYHEIVGKPVSILWDEEPPTPLQDMEGRCIKTVHQHKTGKPIPVQVHCRGICDDRGQIIADLYVIEDLSLQEQMESQLMYAERLSVLGQLAPRIAHEFKTPLQLVLGYAELARELIERDQKEKALRALQNIPEGAQKLIHLVNQISNLGKPEKESKQMLDLKEELEKTLLPLTDLGVIKYCRIETDFQPDLPKVAGDPVQIEQLFRNLIVNAAHAMENCKRKVLTLRLQKTEDAQHVIAEIVDTGSGIRAEDLNLIFQPFFTTKPAGKGTGLGLPIVKTIAERHHAKLHVESQVNQGTVFRLMFPSGEASVWTSANMVAS